MHDSADFGVEERFTVEDIGKKSRIVTPRS